MSDVVRKHPDALCENCPLYHRPMVPTTASPDADEGVDVFWIGEAPAANEVIQQKGFVGDSGLLLWTAAKQVGLSRQKRAAVGNSVMCRPVGKNPTQEALDACRPRLIAEIAKYKPKVIVPLGNYAMATLMGNSIASTKITKQRGRPHNVVFGEPTILFATVHPASMLYNAGAFPDFARDIENIPRLLDGTFTFVDEHEPKHIVVSTPGELEELIDRVVNDGEFRASSRLTPDGPLEVAADLETGGFDYSEGGDEILCTSLAFDSITGYVVAEELQNSAAGKQLLRDLFNIPEIDWTWQNGGFDSNFLVRDIGAFLLHHDTMIMHYAIDERKGTHDLESMSWEYESAPDYKQVIQPYLKGTDGSYRNIPRDVLYKYAAYDAVYTRRLRVTFERIMKEQGLVDVR